MKSFWLIVVLVIYVGLWSGQEAMSQTTGQTIGQTTGQKLAAGTGVYTFDSYGPLSQKPVNIFYYIPTGADISTMPILMAFHGEERDGNAYLQDWIAAANQYKFMVLAPEFAETYYSGGSGYNLGNLFVNGDAPSPNTLNPDSVWTFALIDPIFQDFKRQTEALATNYVAFGHSAGAQFLHRYLIYKPSNVMRKAIAANAGWYTVPTNSVQFPYGTGGSPSTSILAAQSFAKPLLILLGKQDTDPNSAGLRHNTQTDAQGLNRLARGRYFYSQSLNQASLANTQFSWSVAEVAGVGHNHSLMAINAVPYVIDAFERLNQPTPALSVYWTPNAGLTITGLLQNETCTIKIYNLLGAVQQPEVPYPNARFISPPVGGIYWAIVTTSDHGTVIKKFYAL